MLTAMYWKCPNPDCPPTDFPPADCTALGEAPQSVCAGKCGQTYPTAAFRRIP
jgi:hypothetical protein